MNLELATVVACDDAGCSVRLVGSGATIHAAFSNAVRDTIRIRREQLVAVDLDPAVPEIAWRWFAGEVSAEGAALLVRRLDLPAESSKLMANPHSLPVAVGDRVYYSPTDGGQVLDRATPSGPSDVDAFRRTHLPAVEEALRA